MSRVTRGRKYLLSATSHKKRLPDRQYTFSVIFVISAVWSTILSCGLGLGFFSIIKDDKVLKENIWKVNVNVTRIIEIAGEVAFVPSIVIIPYIMQKKGRRKASLVTILPLLCAWILTFLEKSTIFFVLINILHSVAIGGAVSISSIIVSEFCAPKYRGAFLMLETVMLSLGILISHLCGIHSMLKIIPYLGIITSGLAGIITYKWIESPYWLMSQGHIEKSTENFMWIRGHGDDARYEFESLLMIYKTKIQLKALRPVLRLSLRERICIYIKSLMSTEFLQPLAIMILLFTFVGFAGESLNSKHSLRDIFNLSNGKYIGTIVLDAITLLCSLTACIVIHLERRKILFMITGSASVLFLALGTLYLIFQILGMLSHDYIWIYITFGTLFAIFMSLGTTALPFSLLGEMFPMSYKGIGSSLTCAYLWAFSNSVLNFIPSVTTVIGAHGLLGTIIVLMFIILIVLNKIMPETNGKTLVEIEQYYKSNVIDADLYEAVKDSEEIEESFDKLKLLIE